MIFTYIRVLWRRKWLIFVTTIATVSVVAFSSYRSDPVYSATSTLRVVPFGIEQPDYGTFLYFDQLTNTISSILTSHGVAEEAKAQLSLDELPDFTIDVVPNSELLQITVTDANPELTYNTANTLASILIDRVRSQYNTNISRIRDSLSEQVSDLENEIDELIQEKSMLERRSPVNTERITEIERTIDVRQTAYNNLIVSYNQALVAQAVQSSLVAVIEPASLPTEPSGRSFAFWVVLASLLGVVGGIALAFVGESMQPRLYSDKQTERASGQPVLGHISQPNKKGPTNIFMQESTATEMFRRLRTNIVVRMDDSSSQSLVVASLYPNISNTTICYNLAISLALLKKRVLLIDADMRQPKLHTLIKIPNETGFSELLSGQTTLNETIRASDVDKLDIITAGKPIPGTTEIIDQSITRELLQELRSIYDSIVVVGPPLMVVSDSIVLAHIMGNAILTIDDESLHHDVATSVENLTKIGMNFMGIVVIDIHRNASNSVNTYYGAAMK